MTCIKQKCENNIECLFSPGRHLRRSKRWVAEPSGGPGRRGHRQAPGGAAAGAAAAAAQARHGVPPRRRRPAHTQRQAASGTLVLMPLTT